MYWTVGRFVFSASLLFIAVFFCACSINYREGQIAEELEETVPNIRMTDLRHRVATKDRLVMDITIWSSENFEVAKRLVLLGVNFREYGQSGEVTAEGKADQVIYYTDTKNAEIEGNIEILSHKEEGGIRTRYLYWNDERRFLSGSPDEVTEIFDEDGSQFSGKGFEADIKRLIVSFLEAVDGDYVVDDAGESEDGGEYVVEGGGDYVVEDGREPEDAGAGTAGSDTRESEDAAEREIEIENE